MKALRLLFFTALSAAALTGCAGEEGSTPASEPETTAETTVTALTGTTEETTTTTTTTTEPFILDKQLKLEYVPASARPTSCQVNLTNSNEEPLPYTDGINLYTEDGEAIPQLPDYEAKKADSLTINPGDTLTIGYDWSDRYGELAEGSYLFELIIVPGAEPAEDAETDEDAEPADTRPTVLRVPFRINGSDYSPALTIDPASVDTKHCTLTVQNAPDQARDYTMVYRIYDENNNLVMRHLDTESQMSGAYHFEAGEAHDIPFYWEKGYGELPDGDYELEIDFIGKTDKITTTYRVKFTVTENKN